ncbi:MAG: PqqD family protein [Thermoanaerobaculia bacterium]
MPPVSDTARVFRRSPDVVARQVGHESILVPIRHNVGNLDFVYTLSPVAARIWSLLDGMKDIDAILTELSGEYDVDRTTLEADLNELLADLAGASLITQVS